MELPIKIVIVEDEMIIGANISLQLSSLGYEVTGIIPRGEEALIHIKENKPDIALLDIQLKGKLDGIETAKLMQEDFDIPLIYITANADEVNFNRAKDTKPFAFISKPFRKLDLQHAIELASCRIMENEIHTKLIKKTKTFVLNDRIFVKHHDKMVKIIIENILYIEADRNYCRIYTKNKEFLLVCTLKNLEKKLPDTHFVRIHRSYVVNISQIDEVSNNHILIIRKVIPISKTYRQGLLKRLQTI